MSESPRPLDLRVPIGGLFTLDGLLLVGYGALRPPPPQIATLAGNVNLWWGVVLAVFGGTLLALGVRARRR